jgi:hypothetical protein
MRVTRGHGGVREGFLKKGVSFVICKKAEDAQQAGHGASEGGCITKSSAPPSIANVKGCNISVIANIPQTNTVSV